jgi:hypothetical protein
MDRLQRIMIGNGLLVVLVAMLSGFMLMFSLLGGIEVWPGKIIEIPMYGTVDGWVRAHTGGALNGVLVIVVGLALPTLRLSEFMQRFTAYGFIYIAWSFTVFYWLGNASSNRALSIGPSPLGEPDTIGLIGFLPGVPSVFLVIFLLAMAAKSVLSSRKQ